MLLVLVSLLLIHFPSPQHLKIFIFISTKEWGKWWGWANSAALSLPLCMSCQWLWDGVDCVGGGVAAHLEDWAWWRLIKVLVSQGCLFDSTHQRKAPSLRSILSKTKQWQSLETTQPLILTAFILGLGKSCLIHTASDSLGSGNTKQAF